MAEDDLSDLKRVVQQAVETIKQVNGDPIKTAIHVTPLPPQPPQEEAPVRRKVTLRKRRK